MDALENWEKGEPLNFAYWQWGDLRQKEQIRESTDERRSYALKTLLFADLFARLNYRSLLAYGFRTAPTLSDGPVAIPHHCFELRPDIELCDQDIVTASGWHYERVRIVEPAPANAAAIDDSTKAAEKAKVGRRSAYPAARATLIELHSADLTLINIPAEQLIDRFNEHYGQHAKAIGLQSLTLTARTLRDHLASFRKELAETGNKDFAN